MVAFVVSAIEIYEPIRAVTASGNGNVPVACTISHSNAQCCPILYLTSMSDLANIRQKIYVIRGRRVMLDFDLAAAYEVETAQLKRQVRRNMERFEGDDFMFEVTNEEILRCQIGTSSWGGSRYGAFAFTELGVAMLSSVLRSKKAIDTNRDIMRAFVEFRHLAAALPQYATASDLQQLRQDFEQLKQDIEGCLRDQNDINESHRAQLDAISTALAELQPREPKPRKRIGFIQDEDK